MPGIFSEAVSFSVLSVVGFKLPFVGLLFEVSSEFLFCDSIAETVFLSPLLILEIVLYSFLEPCSPDQA